MSSYQHWLFIEVSLPTIYAGFIGDLWILESNGYG
jgi:hypothetical protein